MIIIDKGKVAKNKLANTSRVKTKPGRWLEAETSDWESKGIVISMKRKQRRSYCAADCVFVFAFEEKNIHWGGMENLKGSKMPPHKKKAAN